MTTIKIVVFDGPDMLSRRGIKKAGLDVDLTYPQREHMWRRSAKDKSSEFFISPELQKLIDRTIASQFDFIVVAHNKGFGLEVLDLLPPELLATTLVILPPLLLQEGWQDQYAQAGAHNIVASNRPWLPWLIRKT